MALVPIHITGAIQQDGLCLESPHRLASIHSILPNPVQKQTKGHPPTHLQRRASSFFICHPLGDYDQLCKMLSPNHSYNLFSNGWRHLPRFLHINRLRLHHLLPLLLQFSNRPRSNLACLSLSKTSLLANRLCAQMASDTSMSMTVMSSVNSG